LCKRLYRLFMLPYPRSKIAEEQRLQAELQKIEQRALLRAREKARATALLASQEDSDVVRKRARSGRDRESVRAHGNRERYAIEHETHHGLQTAAAATTGAALRSERFAPMPLLQRQVRVSDKVSCPAFILGSADAWRDSCA
jgi:hypothetical protein